MSEGKKVGGGTLRVDARKAVEKLRSYRHEDPTTWVLEAIRAFVSFGAGELAVDGDADDVFVQASLAAPPIEDLEDLLSELVSPEATSERRGLRLLGSAINSALAIGPSLVDIVRVEADGTETIVRYTTDPAEEPETGATPARDARPPRILAGAGLRVHVRRPLSLAVFGRFLVRGKLPELDHARTSAVGLSVPITVDGKPLAPDDRDLIRVPLGVGLDGHVALIPPDEAEAEAMLEARELGVRLAVLPAALPDLSAPRTRVPIRVVFDSPRLPTDVSRSRVRVAAPIPDVLARANECLAELVSRLAETLEKEPTPALREAAIALLACRVAGGTFVSDAFQLPTTLAKLARIPLVHDATGRLRGLVELSRDTVAIHADDEPVEQAMRSWVGQMLWAGPRMPERRLLGDATFTSSDEVMRRAVAMMRAARTFRSRPLEKAVIERDDALVKVRLEDRVDLPFDLPEAHPDGMRGELVLALPTTVRGELRIHLLHESRAFADLAFPSVLPFYATCDSSVIEPDETYSGVAAGDPGLARTLRVVRQAAMRATLALLAALEGDDPQAFSGQVLGALASFPTLESRTRLSRAAIRQLALSLAQPDGGELPPTTLLEPGSFVAHVEVFPVSRSGGEERLVSLAALVQLASDGLVALPPDARPPGGGHLCTRLTEAERALVASLLPAGTPFVAYPPALARPDVGSTPLGVLRARAMGDSPFGLSFEDGEVRGVVVRTREGGSLVRRHRGVDVDEKPFLARYLPCRVLVEDDGLVPRPSGAPLEPQPPRDLFTYERRLLEAELDAVENDAAPMELSAPSGLPASLPVVREDLVALFVELASSVSGLEALPVQLRERVRRARIFPRIGGPHASLDELREGSRVEPLAFVTATFDPARVADPTFVPLLASAALANALSERFGVALEAADETLEARYARAERQRRLEAHRARATAPSVAPAHATTMTLDAGYARFWPSGRESGLVLRVDVEGRTFAEHREPEGPPLDGEVDLGAEIANEMFTDVDDRARGRLAKLARKAAAAILVDAASKEPARLAEDEAILALAASYARDPGPKDAKDAREALEALRRAPCLPTTRGRVVSLSSLAPKRAVLVAAADRPEPPLVPEEETPPIDREVVCLGTGTRARLLRALLDSLAHGGTRDVGRALEAVIAARRIERGEVAAPTLPDADRAETRSLGALGLDLARVAILGHGAIALADEGQSEVRVFDASGVQVATVRLPEGPPVKVAALSAPLAARASVEGPWPDQERARLVAATVEATRALLVSLAKSTDAFGERTLERLAHAVLDRRLADPTLYLHVPLFLDAKGVRVRLDALAETHPGGIPYVPAERESLAKAAAPGTLVLPRGRLEVVSRMARLVDVSDTLERAASRADFEARPRLAAVNVDETIRGSALVVTTLTSPGRLGEVALLEPAERKRRGLVIVHDGRVLCRLPDPCDYPTHAIVQDPSLVPDEAFAEVERGPAFDSVSAEVRSTSERGLERLYPPPSDALASLVLGPDTRLANVPTDTIVRGELHLARDLASSSVTVVTTQRASGLSIAIAHRGRPGARSLPVPIEGTLLVVAKKGAPNVRPLLLSAYARLVGEAMERASSGTASSDRDLLLAHILHARALALVDARETVDAVELPITASGSRTLGSLVRSLDAFERLPFTSPSDRGDVPGDVLVDDGGPIVRVVLAHLGDRAQRVSRGFEHREVEAAPPPESSAFELTPPAPRPPAPAKAKKPRKTKKAESGAPKPEPARTRAKAAAVKAEPHRAQKVVDALDALVRRVRVPGIVVRHAVLVEDLEEPTVRYDKPRRELLVPGRNPRILELADALERGDPLVATGVRSLAMRAFAAIAKADPKVDPDTLEIALAALLED